MADIDLQRVHNLGMKAATEAFNKENAALDKKLKSICRGC